MRAGLVGRVAAALVVLGAARARADDPPGEPRPAPPIAWLDPAPLAAPFLQLPFDAPATLRPGAVVVGVRTVYSSTILVDGSDRLKANIDLETTQPILFIRYGVRDGAELQLSVSGMVDDAGFLTRPIKAVESLFDAVNPLRAGPPPRQARFRLTRPDGSGIDWSGTRGSVGDVWAGVKGRIREQAGLVPALAWRGAVKLPTAALPFGSGRFESGGGLLADTTFGWTALRLAIDAAFPSGAFSAARVHTQPHATFQLGLARRVASWATLHVQGSIHTSPVTATGITALDAPSYYLLAGVAIEPVRTMSIAFGLVENLFGGHGADITGVLELAWRP